MSDKACVEDPAWLGKTQKYRKEDLLAMEFLQGSLLLYKKAKKIKRLVLYKM